MGLPLKDKCMSVISITVVGSMDQINTMTGRLGNLDGVTVKTAISKEDLLASLLEEDIFYRKNDSL